MTASHLVGLIGAGITTSLTPALHEAEGDAQGLRYQYRIIDIDRIGRTADAAADLVRSARDLGYDALNVTHPCKQAVFDALDELSPDAAALGAVNTVLFRDGRAIGLNTDHSGFAAGLRAGLGSPPLDEVVLLGSGGAGSAIAYALLHAGARRLTVFDPVVERAAAVRERMSAAFPAAQIVAVDGSGLADAVGRADGLVNATPIGMVGHEGMPLAAELLHPRLWVADAVYRPVRTDLIRAAEEMGCAVSDGGRMAVGQAVDAFRLITGVEPDAERMRAHFLELTAGVPEA